MIGRLRNRAADVLLIVAVVAFAVAAWNLPGRALVGTTLQARLQATAEAGVEVDRADVFYREKATRALTAADPKGAPIRKFDLAHGLPAGWRVKGDARARQRGRDLLLSLRTGTMTSAPIELQRGVYELTVDASVRKGGLQIGLVDASLGNCAANAFAWSERTRTSRIPLTVRVTKSRRFYLEFYNWSPDRPAAAMIRSIAIADTSRLLRQDAIARYYRRNVSPPPKASWLSAFIDRGWSFRKGVPAGWAVERGVHVVRRHSGIVVRTGAGLGYAVVSPTIVLDPNVERYVVSVDGHIRAGGLRVAVLDEARQTFVSQGLFAVGSRRRSQYVFAFRRPRRGSVRLILSNWSPVRRPSSWIISRVTLGIVY
jgi:hypothetical protein